VGQAVELGVDLLFKADEVEPLDVGVKMKRGHRARNDGLRPEIPAHGINGDLHGGPCGLPWMLACV
jgi:hypothetical protein